MVTFGFFPHSRKALALDNGTSSAGAVQTSALEVDYGGCDTICNDVFDSLAVASGQTAWDGKTTDFSSIDPKKCADACSTIDSASYPNSAHCFEAPTFSSSSSCSLPDQVLEALSADCATANKIAKGCKFFSSTVVQQCVVQQKAKTTWYWQEIIIGADAVTAAVCAPACVAQNSGLGAPSLAVCKKAAFVANGIEIIGSIAAMIGQGDGQGSTQGFRIAGLGIAGVGMATAIVGHGNAAAGSLGATTAAAGASVESARTDLVNVMGNYDNSPEGTQKWLLESKEGKAYDAALKDKDSVNEKVKGEQAKEDKAESCTTMAIALALGGIRLWSLMDAKGTAKEACTQAESLYSQALAAATAAGGDAVINPNNSVVVNSSDGSLTGTTASGAAMTVTEGVGGDKSIPSVSDIMSGEGFAASAEGQLLGQSGLGDVVQPLTGQLDRSALSKALSSGPSGFTQAALGGAGLTAAQAQAATALVKNAYDNAPKLASRIGGSFYASGGGGGKSGGGSSSSGGNPFASLMGGKGAGQGTNAMSWEIRANAATIPI